MGLHESGVHKSKKQRRLEAMFNAQFGKLLSGEPETEITDDSAERLIANNLAWQQHLDKQKRDAIDALELELSKHIRAVEPTNTLPEKPAKKFEKSHKGLTVVLTVRKQSGGNPFRYIYKAPVGMFKTEAEHNARIEIRKKGLTLYAHIETIEPAAFH